MRSSLARLGALGIAAVLAGCTGSNNSPAPLTASGGAGGQVSNAAAAPSSFIRFVHGSPDAPNVDICVDGAPAAPAAGGAPLLNVPYKTVSPEIPITAGTHQIAIFPSPSTGRGTECGSNGAPGAPQPAGKVLTLTVAANARYAVVATGYLAATAPSSTAINVPNTSIQLVSFREPATTGANQLVVANAATSTFKAGTTPNPTATPPVTATAATPGSVAFGYSAGTTAPTTCSQLGTVATFATAVAPLPNPPGYVCLVATPATAVALPATFPSPPPAAGVGGNNVSSTGVQYDAFIIDAGTTAAPTQTIVGPTSYESITLGF